MHGRTGIASEIDSGSGGRCYREEPSLILLGFLYGAWYAGVDLYRHEARESQILKNMLDAASRGTQTGVLAVGNDYGLLAAEKAVKIAAHSHIIEFGLLAMLLSFVQPYVFLSDRWKRRWVQMLLAGSVILPVFVLLELNWGLVAGGIADVGGLMVVIALVGMLVGCSSLLREPGCRTGEMRMSQRAQDSHLRRLALAAFGMLYGLHYALFVEHQTLDRMGGSLAGHLSVPRSAKWSQAHALIDTYARDQVRLRSPSRCPFALDRSGDGDDRAGRGV